MPQCKGCFYSREFGSETAVACHRWPPTITKVEGTTITSNFPLVSNESWCGEYSAIPKQNVKVRTATESRK